MQPLLQRIPIIEVIVVSAALLGGIIWTLRVAASTGSQPTAAASSLILIVSNVVAFVSLYITYLGFRLTLKIILETEDAAKQSRAAVDRTLKQMGANDILTECQRAVSLAKATQAQPAEAVALIALQFSDLCERLIGITSARSTMNETEIEKLDTSIDEGKTILQSLRSLKQGASIPDEDQRGLIEFLTNVIFDLDALTARLRSQVD